MQAVATALLLSMAQLWLEAARLQWRPKKEAEEAVIAGEAGMVLQAELSQLQWAAVEAAIVRVEESVQRRLQSQQE